jgi:endonuclease YncB( thermonuclease family)
MRKRVERSVERFVGATVFALSALSSSAALAQACGSGAAQSTGIVRAVADARTLVLEDGRRVLLEAVEVPGAFDRVSADRPGAPAALAKAALTERLLGQSVTLKGRPGNDRHGRLRAFVFSQGPDLEASVQHDMVSRGLARVASLGSGPACAAELFAREREARAAGRGLWADSKHAVLRADDPASILEARGRMAVIEGRVLSVRESGGTIYVNFGRRWSQDFTVTIAKRSEKVFTGGGLPPKGLERRDVRVRGWVEERGGPWVEATSPEQFELLGP